MYRLLICLVFVLPLAAHADNNPAALDSERRWFIGIGGATSQSRISAGSDAGRAGDTLTDTLVARAGRYSGRMRYGIDVMRVNYDEARVWMTTAWLDYLIPLGDLFSGYAGIAAGHARLNWRENDPFDAGRNFGLRGQTDDSWTAGLRVGGLIEVTELVQVELGYRFLFTDLETRFRDGDVDERVTFRNQRAVQAGVNFRF